MSTPENARMRLSVIVPFHRNRAHLASCLPAIRAAVAFLPAGLELADILVVADGAVDDPADLVRSAGARLVRIEGPAGPAVARNRGAACATGDVIVFIDADVVVHADALAKIAARFCTDPALAAIFGAYDDRPPDPGFFSQCRNLSHAFVHRRSAGEARTFWAGLGAVRAPAFAAVQGFDERFTRPAIEDIDLGYRLTAAGFRIALDPSIEGCHLKRWTFVSSIVSDVRDRGVPWTQLLHRYGAMTNDLNITYRYRACVIVAFVLAASLAGSALRPALVFAGPILGAILWTLERPYYHFLADRRGWRLALCWFPFHVLHHVCNGVSFAAGSALFYLRKCTGLALPWSLPVTAWPRDPRPRHGAHVAVR